jgi:DNA-binding XRE family transcriptional regulator
MRVRTKEHLIEVRVKGVLADLILQGPEEKTDKLISALNDLGFKAVEGSVPWREAFSEYSDEQLPGICLSGARRKEGLTQKQLAKIIGMPQRHISEMENSKRPIGKNMAKKLGKALNIGYKVFL